jgi:hypothetical protein
MWLQLLRTTLSGIIVCNYSDTSIHWLNDGPGICGKWFEWIIFEITFPLRWINRLSPQAERRPEIGRSAQYPLGTSGHR